MSYGRIGVIGAMDSELAALIAALAQPAQETVQGLIFDTGRLGAREVVLVRCGIGKVSGAIIGVLLVQIIFAGLNFLSVDANYLYIVKGLIILIACSIDMRKYLVRK